VKSQLPDAVPVVVLKLDPNIFHHGALGIVRSLGRLGAPTYAVQEDRWAPMAHSRYLRQALPWMEASASTATISRLTDLGRTLDQRAILIPTDDVASVFVAEHRPELEEHYMFPHMDEAMVRSLCSKQGLYLLCREFGVPAPETWFPRSRKEVEELIQEATFPLVLKAIDPWLLHGTVRLPSVVIVESPHELLRQYDEMEDPSRPNLMIQEYIPGGPESVWMYNGYFDAQSESLVHFTGQKLRQHPPYTGMTTLGICQDNEVVETTTKQFMKAVGYRGIVDMGYRYDRRDGQYKLLDVNPRIGATFRLFVDPNGIDVVRALYLDLTGREVAVCGAVNGRTWMVENHDLLSSMRYIRDGRLTPRAWLLSLRGVDERAWFASDDPMPFAVMALRFLARAPQKVLSGVRRGRPA
jgi:predicted ATP-grasp superfamily ATP-dependent carboligase